VPELADTTCLGAALLGGLAGGVFTSLGEARSGLRVPARVVEPMPGWDDDRRQRRQATYAAAYAALRPLHARLLDG
jgi:xylulokinase